MADGDLAFACQCPCQVCSRFFTRYVERPFVGAFINSTQFVPATSRRKPLRFFRRYQFSSPAYSFTEEWSIDRGSYGQVTTTGTAPERSFSSVALGPIIVEPSLLAAVGAYVLTRNQETFLYEVTSYEVDEEYRVTAIDGETARVFSEWLSAQILEEDVMQLDLDDPTESFLRPNDPIRAPQYDGTLLTQDFVHEEPGFSKVFEYQSESAIVGGYIDTCDGFSDFQGGHSYRNITEDTAGMFGVHKNNELQRTVLYVGGDHNLTEHVYQNADILSCTDISVTAGAPGYTINPPATNDHVLIWHENGRC